MNVLEVRHLKKSYKKGFIPRRHLVLNDVSFKLKPGRITGFLGGNGAGKTTTMKCILGLSYADSGDILFFGDQPLSNNVKARIGFLPERPYFYDYLTGKEFLQFYGQISTRLKKKDLNTRIDMLLKKLDLLHARDKRLRTYSKGMLQKIGLAQAIIHNPEFVILDEPKSGLDPDGRFYLSEIIRETARNGTTVFFSSHLLHDAELLCESLVILSGGQVVFEGLTHDLLDRMGQTREISYLASGTRQSETYQDLADVQRRIDEIRKNGGTIEEVRVARMNLEQAFVKIALRGEKL